jgi:prolipoprotein diacylglyceryl transferase
VTDLLSPVLSIPSPPTGVWDVFGFPLRAYALCIIAGIVVAMVISNRRWTARGGSAESLEMVIVVAVPFGIVGARIYHVITDYQLYFGPGRHPVDALKIWNGGLGIWGAVAFGALGGYLVARRRKISFPAFLDAVAPGLAVAQAIGRLGNWFNQELFGRPTTLPWGLEIAPRYRPAGFTQFETFHPTFLYELVWNLGVALALVLLDRKFRLGHGKVFALYVVFYTAGRFWIEALRIDKVNEIGGFRLNNYTSVIVFVVALAWFLWLVKNRPGREAVVEGEPPAPAADSSDDSGAEAGHEAGAVEEPESGISAVETDPGDAERGESVVEDEDVPPAVTSQESSERS